MIVTMVRAGHYVVTDEGRLAGRVTGDFVIGFRAVLPDGAELREVFDEPEDAALVLVELTRDDADAGQVG
ncbi:MAG TPA: hypothetical protein VFJ12_16065 [Segeticoccus sp.]|nr:hypothetical protein [Segeticoccus sp.]